MKIQLILTDDDGIITRVVVQGDATPEDFREVQDVIANNLELPVPVPVPVPVPESVEIIASGYEWTCPVCEILHKIIEVPHDEHVHCPQCGNTFHTDFPNHAMA